MGNLRQARIQGGSLGVQTSQDIFKLKYKNTHYVINILRYTQCK